MKHQRTRRRGLSLVAVLGLLAGLLVAFAATPAGAAGTGSTTQANQVGAGTVTATPYRDVSNGEAIALTGTGLAH